MIADATERQAEIEALFRRYAVSRLDLFGSAASGDFRPEDSDLDFLVKFQDADSAGYADRFFGLLESLEQLFCRPVDLVVDSAITNPYFRASVARSRVALYAA